MPKFARSTAAHWNLAPLWKSAAGSLVLLCGWMLLAGLLRGHHLMLKPLWTDEFSTLVFGIGNRFQTVPLNQVMDAERLLAPVQPASDATMADAARHLLTESNHPPLYFMLTQAWTGLFPNPDGYVSVWGARSLSALLGVLAVPAMYLAGWVSFRRRAIAHLSAALMAVSPFGIYLAQDARHYTLTVVWMILSLTCLVQAIRDSQKQQPLPVPVVLGWIGVNGLGMASHYFFALTLLAEAIALILILALWWHQQKWRGAGLGRIGLAVLGTIAASGVWFPFIFAIRQGDALTQWLYVDGWKNWAWIDPLLHTISSIASMVMFLPVQNVDIEWAIASGLLIVALTTLLVRFTGRGLRAAYADPTLQVPILTFTTFIGGAIALIFLITYGVGLEIAKVFRYHFIYYPAVLLLVAAGTAPYWTPSLLSAPGTVYRRRGLVILVILLGIVGSLTVTNDWGYRKLHRPDQIVEDIAKRYEAPVLLAISHQTHGQTGRLMALAWEMRSPPYDTAIRDASFFLDHRPCTLENKKQCNQPSEKLQQVIRDMPRPVDVWLLNYEGRANLTRQGCEYERTKRTDGYKAQHYTCRRLANQTKKSMKTWLVI